LRAFLSDLTVRLTVRETARQRADANVLGNAPEATGKKQVEFYNALVRTSTTSLADKPTTKKSVLAKGGAKKT